MGGLRDRTIDELQAKARAMAECGPQMATGCGTGPVSQEAYMQSQIDRWFTYRAPSDSQHVAMKNIREAAKVLALTILANAKDNSQQRQALEAVRVAVMFANESIAG